VVGPLLALLFLDAMHLPMRRVFMIAVIPGAIGVLLLMIALKEPRGADRGPRTAATIEGPALPMTFYRALAAIALFSLANSSDAFLILQAHTAGVATGLLPLLWAAHHVIKALFSTQAGAASDRFARRYLLVAGWTTYAVIYFLFPFARSVGAFFVLFVAYAIPFTLTEGSERAWISDFVPAELRGKGFGIYYLVSGFGVLAGTALFGALYEYVSPQTAFDAGAALAIAAAIAAGTARGTASSR
jgi:MFS family permease